MTLHMDCSLVDDWLYIIYNKMYNFYSNVLKSSHTLVF